MLAQNQWIEDLFEGAPADGCEGRVWTALVTGRNPRRRRRKTRTEEGSRSTFEAEWRLFP